jgi:hypothetical protein
MRIADIFRLGKEEQGGHGGGWGHQASWSGWGHRASWSGWGHRASWSGWGGHGGGHGGWGR